MHVTGVAAPGLVLHEKTGRNPAGIRPVLAELGSVRGGRRLRRRGSGVDRGSGRVDRDSGVGGSSGIGGSSIASSGSGIAGGVDGRTGGVSGFVGSGGGVSSGFLRGLDGLFLLGAASEGQGGKGGGESDLRVHIDGYPKR